MHEDREVPCMLGELDVVDFNQTTCLFARKFVYNQLPSSVSFYYLLYLFCFVIFCFFLFVLTQIDYPRIGTIE